MFFSPCFVSRPTSSFSPYPTLCVSLSPLSISGRYRRSPMDLLQIKYTLFVETQQSVTLFVNLFFNVYHIVLLVASMIFSETISWGKTMFVTTFITTIWTTPIPTILLFLSCLEEEFADNL